MKERIVEYLRSTNRPGMNGLIEYLETGGFFNSPASTKYHGCYEGGLMKHSWNVYELLVHYNLDLDLNLEDDTLAISTFLHDLCKMGAYLGDRAPYQFNRMQPKGHAALSIARAKQFIKLTEMEERMIRFHMGVYGTVEGVEYGGEYRLQELVDAWSKYPAVKTLYFVDELATLSEKASEKNSSLNKGA